MAVAAKRSKPATYEELLSLPENCVGEIVDGDLLVSPRPAPAHALASSSLGAGLSNPFSHGRGGPGGWVILDEPELHLATNVLVPDLAGWRRERMSTLPSTAWFELTPDWVCEVLSPATALMDRTRKQEAYRAHGVPWLWFVDPAARTIEVLRNGDSCWLLTGTFGGATEARIPPFDAVALDLSTLWELSPSTTT